MELQDVWGGFIIWYLFLAGVGAGAYFISALADYLGKKDRVMTKTGIFLGAPLVAIGSLLLMADLGRPERFLYVFFNPGSSMLSIGAIIITMFIIVGFIHIAFLIIPGLKGKLTRRAELSLQAVGIFLALVTAAYTGILLGVLQAIPFWNTPILPVLFLFSALSTGIGVVILSNAIYRRILVKIAATEEAEIRESFHLMGKSDMIFISAEFLTLFFLFTIMFNSPVGGAESASFLLTGGYALIFWIGVVLVGLLVPLALESVIESKKNRISLSAMSSVGMLSGICLLIGGLLLRYAVVAAGATAPLM